MIECINFNTKVSNVIDNTYTMCYNKYIRDRKGFDNMTKPTWKEVENNYPNMKRYGFDDGGCMGFCNYMMFFSIDDEVNYYGMELEQIKPIIKKIKEDCKEEILQFLSKHGVENGGEWYYCEYLDVNEDGTFDGNSYFGVSSFDCEGDTNFSKENIYVDEQLKEVGGL